MTSYENIRSKDLEEQRVHYTAMRDFWKAAAEKYPTTFNRQQHGRYEAWLEELNKEVPWEKQRREVLA